MRLGAKMFAACAVVIAGLVGVAGWSLLAVHHLVRAQQDIIEGSVPALQLAAALRDGVPRLLRLEARHLALSEHAYAELLAERADRAAADLQRLGELVGSPHERRWHQEAGAAFAAYRRHLEASRALLAERRVRDATRLSEGPARAAAQELDRALGELIAATAAEIARARAAALALERRTWTAVLLALGGSVVAALAVAGAVAVGATRSLRRLSAATAEVASGSFPEALPIPAGDEVGDLTRAFNDMARRLREVEAQKRQFFAHVSHELRSPLTAIRSASQLLLGKSGGTLDAKQRRWLQLMDESVDRLIAMVNEILDWNRLRAGVFPLERRALALDALVERTLELLRPQAEASGLLVRLTSQGESFDLEADADALVKIVTNLVGNALKFTPRGGTVAVEVADGGDAVTLVVRDDGPGIPAADAARIFEPYEQAHAGRHGSGLGLAIVRELVTAHGGTVGVESDAGQGACFTVRLPRGAAAPEACAA